MNENLDSAPPHRLYWVSRKHPWWYMSFHLLVKEDLLLGDLLLSPNLLLSFNIHHNRRKTISVIIWMIGLSSYTSKTSTAMAEIWFVSLKGFSECKLSLHDIILLQYIMKFYFNVACCLLNKSFDVTVIYKINCHLWWVEADKVT